MARQRCLRRLKSPPERSSRRIQNAVVASSFSTSWTVSPRLFRTANFTSSSTTSTPTRRTSLGSRPTPMCNFISRRQARPGSIRSSLVLDLAGAVAQRHLLHKPPTAPAAHRCLHQAYNDKAEPFVWTRKRSVNAASKVAVSLRNRTSVPRASPDLKLVTQPPTQLPVAFASFASCAAGDIGDAGGVGVVGDARGDTVLRAAARCFGFCGLATCFGASTTTLGSEAVAPPEGVAVCDIAVPLRPHRSSAIDRLATARLATKSDENLTAMSS